MSKLFLAFSCRFFNVNRVNITYKHTFLVLPLSDGECLRSKGWKIGWFTLKDVLLEVDDVSYFQYWKFGWYNINIEMFILDLQLISVMQLSKLSPCLIIDLSLIIIKKILPSNYIHAKNVSNLVYAENKSNYGLVWVVKI